MGFSDDNKRVELKKQGKKVKRLLTCLNIYPIQMLATYFTIVNTRHWAGRKGTRFWLFLMLQMTIAMRNTKCCYQLQRPKLNPNAKIMPRKKILMNGLN